VIERSNGKPLKVILIAAMSENHVIAKDGNLPWRLPNDLKHFKDATRGHAVVMGRATFETLSGPLPHRENIVMTTRRDWSTPGVVVAHTYDAALRIAAERSAPQNESVYIVGGGVVYAEAIQSADELDLTRVHTTIEGGDATFPDVDPSIWRRVANADFPADDRHTFGYSFERWVRC
tara:strand:+ start:87 stop:617 length:531 start_codon:yes stop_codon:yes gene_type:complete